ncbi:ABC transporter permease [Tepidibacter hydrothermalis]|uniref:ABC transporter permease n=1 Tax=Tepidibacter hydrothermalis TaxID=3036126 RepID=A0ABY8ECR6_9FIRM|nr:ABC transporter permease [Tepidibacter hydrothermalis]WFD09379.1 ABC transporter permease [Tepidibacter hydrothermalis]
MHKLGNILKEMMKGILSPFISVLLAFFVSGILLLLVGTNPLEAYSSLLNGAFGSSHRIGETIIKAIPFIILGLGISVAFKAQIWNIGADGQFTLGAIFAMIVALYLPFSNIIKMPLSFIAAFVGGACWGGIAAFLKTKFNANEVITTLMLNYIAFYLLEWLVKGPMMDPNGHGFPQTALIHENLRLPIILKGTRLHLGILLAVILIIGGYYFWKTVLGFKIEVVGQSPYVAEYSGIKVNKTIGITMCISAGLAGLAGWTEVFGLHYRLLENISGGYGNLAIVVALLAGLNPFGIIISAFFFAALVVGGNSMQRMVGVPFSLVDVIQGLVIIFIISRVIYTRWREQNHGKNTVNSIYYKLIRKFSKDEYADSTCSTR